MTEVMQTAMSEKRSISWFPDAPVTLVSTGNHLGHPQPLTSANTTDSLFAR